MSQGQAVMSGSFAPASNSPDFAMTNGGGAVRQMLQEKLSSTVFAAHGDNLVRSVAGKDLTVAYLQKEGFESPLFVADKADLDLKVPATRDCGVSYIRAAVGSRRCVDAVDCDTRKATSMTMKDWQRYFEQGKDRTNVLNVISLEFSGTKLDAQVVSPRIVRQIDWIDKAWPRHLKELQVETTNCPEDMMYPKVQKYCVMSAERAFTDFHIDCGGSSAWYHVLSGKKIFWLIPPTDDNLQLYEDWVLAGGGNGGKSDGGNHPPAFFGDRVSACGRLEVGAGQTVFVPGGWIHAVYAAQDTIMFGGNFLHSFNIEKQLVAAHIEEITHMPSKFRFPFFTEILW